MHTPLVVDLGDDRWPNPHWSDPVGRRRPQLREVTDRVAAESALERVVGRTDPVPAPALASIRPT